MLDLYKNIKSRRVELGITQEELAKKTGYADKSIISRIEAGKVDLPQSKIETFAEALRTTPGDLMGWNEEPEDVSDFRQRILEENHTIFEALEKATPEERKTIEKIIKTIVSDD